MNTELNDEIDLTDLLKKIYKSRKLIIYFSLIFLLLGIITAFILPIKYSSSTVFIPQNQENSTSSLTGVASLVGINLGPASYGGDIPSSMYPQIGESPRFKRLLLEKIIDKENNLTLKKFLIEHYKIDKTSKTSSSSLAMSKLEESCFDILTKIISINVNKKDGFVTINSTMPVAEYSAIIAKKSREILQNIIIENKIETARQNLNFSQKQLSEKKLEFDEIQSKLAYFSDSNLNTVNSFVNNEKDKLQAEFQIINAVVTELSKQVEQAKLQVTKDTPVFSTIKEAIIPNKKTSPKRIELAMIFLFSGFAISIISVLAKDLLKNIYLEINN